MHKVKECYVCHNPYNLHKHHIFYGTANRKLSEKFGCWCYLCANHHNMSKFGVHFDKKLDKKLKQICAKQFKLVYGTDPVNIFNKNYMGEDNGLVE